MLFKNNGIKNIRKKSKRDEAASEITEAEILSMVNEGNENGSLLTSIYKDGAMLEFDSWNKIRERASK